jgi:hypothetical protein
MSRKIAKPTIRESDILYSEIEGREYPADVIKDVFIKSGMSPERIAKKYFIPLKKILEYANAFGWFKLKQEHDRMVLHTALNMRRDSFLETLTTDQKEQKLKNFQRNQELDEVEKHLQKYGHLYCVDPTTDEIIYSKLTGLPLKLNFGSSKEEIQSRREIQASIEANLKMLSETTGIEAEKASENEIINIDPIKEIANRIIEDKKDE